MRRTVTAAPAHVRPRVLVGRGRAVAERDGAAQKAPAEGAGGGGGEGGGVQGTRAGWAAALVAVERLVLEAHAAQRDVARGDALRDRRAHQLALAAVGVEVVDGAVALHAVEARVPLPARHRARPVDPCVLARRVRALAQVHVRAQKASGGGEGRAD